MIKPLTPSGIEHSIDLQKLTSPMMCVFCQKTASIIDPQTNEVIVSIYVDYSIIPANHHQDRFGRIWGMDWADRSLVRVIDAKTMSLVKTINVGGVLEPLEVTPDGKTAIIPAGSKHQAWAFDTATTEVIEKIGTGKWPCDMDCAPNGKLAYTPNRDEDSISILNTAQLKEETKILTKKDHAPYMLTVSPDGKYVFVENAGTRSFAQDYLPTGGGKSESIIDTSTNEIVKEIPLGGTPIFDEFTPDGKKCYITLVDTGEVAVIDVPTLNLTKKIKVGERPFSLQMGPEGRFVYIPNSGGNTISVIDTTLDSVVKTINIGRMPLGLVTI